MEPITEWMEEELQRNDMHPKKDHGSPLGVPQSYRPPVKATVGAAEVTFHPNYESHSEDAYQVPEHFLTGELYSPPDVPKPKGISEPEAEQLTLQFLNVLGKADGLPRDMVTLPEHYARFTIEPIRFICENNLNFFQANIIKYILRYDAKNGMEDLKKAQRYLTMFIKFVEGNPDWWRK